MKKNRNIFFFFILFYYYLSSLGVYHGAALFAQNKNTCGEHGRTIDSLLTLLKTSKEDTSKINALNALALEFSSSNPDTAMILSNEALQLATVIVSGEERSGKQSIVKQSAQTGIGDSYHLIGYFYYLKGDYARAFENYRKALEIWESLLSTNHQSSIANKKSSTLGNIGIVYKDQGNYPKAIDYYFKALKIDEDMNNKKGIAARLGSIGIVYWDQKDYPRSLEYFFKALKMDEESGNKNGIARNFGNIGGVYMDQGDSPKAIDYCFKALKIKQELGNKIGIAIHLGNIGGIYTVQGNYPRALEYYFKALKMKEELGAKNEIVITLGNIGLLYISTKKYSEAEKYLQKSLSLAEEIGSLDHIRTVNETISELYTQTSNYKEALEHYKKAMKIKDSLFNEEKDKDITRIEMNYEFDKKEAATKFEQEKKDIETQLQLQKKNQVIYILAGTGLILVLIVGLVFSFYRQNKLQAKQKNMELQQKLLRTQMNPHFIFNALMSIQSFIYENEPKEAGVFLSRFAKLMRMILETSNEDYISLKKELNTLENYLELQKLRFENKFEYLIEVNSQLDTETIVIPPMLTQPFIENALEHGLRYLDKKGLIKVVFGFDKESMTIEVQDNGIGREKSAELKKESETTHQSMAMEISKERLFILNKGHKRKITLNIFDLKDDTNNPAGTRVVFTIPFKEIDV